MKRKKALSRFNREDCSVFNYPRPGRTIIRFQIARLHASASQLGSDAAGHCGQFKEVLTALDSSASPNDVQFQLALALGRKVGRHQPE